MAFSWLASYLCVHVFKKHKLEYKLSAEFLLTRIAPLGFATVRDLLLCPSSYVLTAATATQAATLGLGNTAYLFLSVSFIQMLKAATPLMTLLVLACTGLERPSPAVRVCCAVRINTAEN